MNINKYKYIIMCGGKYHDTIKPKHLYEINGEVLVERTIRILKELGITDISVSTTNPAFNYLIDKCGIKILSHMNRYDHKKYNNFTGYWVDAFYPMTVPTAYICGDTYFSEDALKQIVMTDADDILFFGTAKPFAPGYSKIYEEPLAFKVVDHKLLKEKCDYIRYLQDNNLTKRKPISWELYRVIDGIDPDKHILGKRFVGIHSFASDIDKESEVVELERDVAAWEQFKLKCDKLKIAICAIAKDENLYINDWVNYHINLGVNDIYIYDNNDRMSEPVEKVIKLQNKGRVIIQKIPGARNFQKAYYTDFYNKYGSRYDYIFFIDIDEFITIKRGFNFREIVGQIKHNITLLKWRLYGDDDLITRDMKLPVYKVFKKVITDHPESNWCKSCVKGGLSNLTWTSVHSPKLGDKKPVMFDIAGNIMLDERNNPSCNNSIMWINHYKTKSLSEFVDSKLKRGTDACWRNKKIDMSYYFNLNKITKEKEDYLKSKGFKI